MSSLRSRRLPISQAFRVSTEVRRPIPKDAFFNSKSIKGREKEKFDKQIHNITIRSIISPESVNIDKGKDVSAIYLMELQLNVQDCDDGNLMLLNKLGHKAVYVLSYGDVLKIAVIEEILFKTDWIQNTEYRLELEGLDLDAVWANIVRDLGNCLAMYRSKMPSPRRSASVLRCSDRRPGEEFPEGETESREADSIQRSNV